MRRLIKMSFSVVLMAFLHAVSVIPIQAVGESHTRAVGMGGAYVAIARNIDSVGWNPANLGLPSQRKIVIAVFSAGGGIGNSAFTLGDYNRYNGEFWNESDKQTILSEIPPKGLTVNAVAEARALGISVGKYAL